MLDQLDGTSAEESWRWFIERYRGYIAGCLNRLIHPRELADQALDEIWSYLFTSSILDNADRDRRFRTYLAGTVRNFAMDWRRRRARASTSQPVDEPCDAADPSRLCEAQDMQLWTRQVVQLALAEVERSSPDQANALRWFYGLPDAVDGDAAAPRSASWIASQLGIRTNAAHQLVFRARNGLRRCIERELRETVRNVEDLVEERQRVYTVIAADSPGLGPPPDA